MSSIIETPKTSKRGIIKQCVICGTNFQARGRDKTCSPECSGKNKCQRRKRYYADPVVKERVRQYNRQRYADPEFREWHRQWHQRYNADPIVKERRRQYDQQRYSNPAVREWHRQWHQRYFANYKNQNRINVANRAARKRELPATLTNEQWQSALNYFGGCCAVCGRQMNDMFGEFYAAQDHWVPLSYKGTDNPGSVAENTVPLCHGINGCNNSKNSTMPDVWLRQRYSERKARQIEQRVEEYFEWLCR